jgi:hypothetical protein
MRIPFLLLALVLAAPLARAQGRRGPDGRRFGRGPSTWLSVSSGYTFMNAVPDGRTASTWDFGNAWPLRASLERTIGGNSVGIEAMYIRAPLLYRSANCFGSCSAHGTAAAYGPILRLGGGGGGRGGGVYQVLEAFGGVMQYGNFTEDRTGLPLPPDKPDHDFAFSLGIGMGYPLGSDFALELMLSQMHALHERTNLLPNAQTMVQHTSLTLALRIGY